MEVLKGVIRLFGVKAGVRHGAFFLGFKVEAQLAKW